VNVGGLWRTSVELKEEATWYDLKTEIDKVTGIGEHWQKLEPDGKDDKKCELEEGDDVFCDWELCKDHPLHCAAFFGNIEAIRSWLASGADVNVINDVGRTPLMFACSNLKEECMMELLRLGSNVHMIDNYGDNILHCVAYINLKNMERIAKTLIKAGCNPTTCNKNGETFIDVLKNYNRNELATKLEEWITEQI